MPAVDDSYAKPHLSLVMPCYNEEEVLGYSMKRLLDAFDRAGYRLQLVAVDNGSSDRTGEIIREFAGQRPEVVYHRVEVNQGYGNGILQGIPLCTAPWIGISTADGQVDAEDTVRLFDVTAATGRGVLGKVRRRFRMDSFARKVTSIVYNLLFLALWPGIGSVDINGNPKILPRDLLDAMDLQSRSWFLDAEMMIKAHDMGIPVLELNVFGRMRPGGSSHVRPEACLEFLREMLVRRFLRPKSRTRARRRSQAL